jgi:hypothetical protein
MASEPKAWTAEAALVKHAYLTVYDYGTGGIWVYIRAETPDQITAKFRDVVVYETKPDWMGERRRGEIEARGVYDDETIEAERPLFAGLPRKRS